MCIATVNILTYCPEITLANVHACHLRHGQVSCVIHHCTVIPFPVKKVLDLHDI